MADRAPDTVSVNSSRVPRRQWWWAWFGGRDPSDATAHPVDESGGAEWEEGIKLMEKGSSVAKTPEYVPSDTEAAPGQAGVVASTFNLCNVCLGAGTLSMPFAFRNVGIGLGLILLTLVYVLMVLSAILLTESARLVNPHEFGRSYGGVVKAAFGNKGTIATQVIIVIATYGIAIAYFQLVGDLLSPPIGYWLGDTPSAYCSFWAKREAPMYFALALEAVLCAMPTLHALRHVSLLAVVSMLYMTVVVVIRSGERWKEGPLEGDSMLTFDVTAGAFRSISIITFAFAPHIQMLTMFNEMRNPTRSRVCKWLWSSLTTCWLVYVCVGIFGYLTFYGKTEGNVLLNHEADDLAVTIGRIGVAISVLAGYPMMSNPCVASLDALVFPTREPSIWGRRLVWLVFVLGSTFLIAMLITDVSLVLGLTGAGALTAAAFVLPAAVYIKLNQKRGLCGGPWMRTAWFIMISGILFGTVAVVVTIIDAIDEDPPIDCTWPVNCPKQRCCPPGGVYGNPVTDPSMCP